MQSKTPPYTSGVEHEEEGALPSLFLPLVAPSKYPPLPRAELPTDALIWLATAGAFQAILPFEFGAGAAEGDISNVEDFNKTVRRMLIDREWVIRAPLALQLAGGERSFVAEYAFAIPLLRRVLRLTDLAALPDVTAYNLLVDLLAQGISCKDKYRSKLDEFQNVWLLLRDAAPYRENSFFTNSAVLIQTIGAGSLIKITIGETEEDFDEWYRYEWLSQIVKQHLRLAHGT